MDFTLYWFMFPVAVVVATIAMLSGIGGTALFMPIFLLLFPLLGPEFPITNPVTAVAAALLTSTFGFTSGFIGYYRKKLIDFDLSKRFLIFSVPAALFGVLCAHWISPTLLRFCYGLLLLLLSFVMVYGFTLLLTARPDRHQGISKNKVDDAGISYVYKPYDPRKGVTLIGGFITGMLATGIGEVIMPQLVKDGEIPLPIAAAASVVAVMGTILVASVAHTITLINMGGFAAVPWHLVCYTIPGVIIGGQLGPRLQGKVPANILTKAIAWIFLILGICMIWTVYNDLTA